MNNILKQSEIESKIIDYNGTKVILDFDVASMYGVETKHVNQAVKNNPEKFPENYVLFLNMEDWKICGQKF
jgi:hypothetical protein